jgi:hypothetical protein
MPAYRVKKAFTDTEGTHEVGSVIESPNETEDQRYDLAKMVEYGMLEEALKESAQLAMQASLRKSRKLARPNTKK